MIFKMRTKISFLLEAVGNYYQKLTFEEENIDYFFLPTDNEYVRYVQFCTDLHVIPKKVYCKHIRKEELLECSTYS